MGCAATTSSCHMPAWSCSSTFLSQPALQGIMDLSAPRDTALPYGMVCSHPRTSISPSSGERKQDQAQYIMLGRNTNLRKSKFPPPGAEWGKCTYSALTSHQHYWAKSTGTGWAENPAWNYSHECHSCKHHQQDPRQGGPWRCSAKQCKNQKKTKYFHGSNTTGDRVQAARKA